MSSSDDYWFHRNRELERIDDAARSAREWELERDHVDEMRDLGELTRKRERLEALQAANRERRESEALELISECRKQILDSFDGDDALRFGVWQEWSVAFAAIDESPESIPRIAAFRAVVEAHADSANAASALVGLRDLAGDPTVAQARKLSRRLASLERRVTFYYDI